MQAEGRRAPHGDRVIVAVVLDRAVLHQARIDTRALRQVLEHARELDHFGVGKAPRRDRRHDEADVGHAVDHHLRLLLRRPAEGAVRIELDLDRAAGGLVHRSDPWFLHRVVEAFGIGREGRHLQLHRLLCRRRERNRKEQCPHGRAHRDLPHLVSCFMVHSAMSRRRANHTPLCFFAYCSIWRATGISVGRAPMWACSVSSHHLG